MGREAHILRVALGLGSTEAPDWSSIGDQYSRVAQGHGIPPLYRGVDSENLVTFGQVFDAKGRPYSLEACDRDLLTRAALNEVTSLTLPPRRSDEDYENEDDASRRRTSDDLEVQFKSMFRLPWTYFATTLLNTAAVTWIDSIRRRLLTFDTFGDASFSDDLREDFISRGMLSSLASGMPSEVTYLFLAKMVTILDVRKHSLDEPPKPLNRLIFFLKPASELFSGLLILNSEFQQLHMLPASTFKSPLPLVNLLIVLPPRELVSCLIMSVIPASILCRWWRFKLSGQIAATIRSNLITSKIMTKVRKMRIQGEKSNREQTRLDLKTAPGAASLVNTAERAFFANMTGYQGYDNWHLLGTVQGPIHMQINQVFRWLIPWQSNDRKGNAMKLGEFNSGVLLPLYRLGNWCSLLCTQLEADFIRDILMFPVAGLMTRVWVRGVLSNPAFLGTDRTRALAVTLRPIFPGLSSLSTTSGLRSAGRLLGKIGMIFVLQAAVWTTLVGVESAVAIILARRLNKRKRKSLGQYETEDGLVVPHTRAEDVD